MPHISSCCCFWCQAARWDAVPRIHQDPNGTRLPERLPLSGQPHVGDEPIADVVLRQDAARVLALHDFAKDVRGMGTNDVRSPDACGYSLFTVTGMKFCERRKGHPQDRHRAADGTEWNEKRGTIHLPSCGALSGGGFVCEREKDHATEWHRDVTGMNWRRIAPSPDGRKVRQQSENYPHNADSLRPNDRHAVPVEPTDALYRAQRNALEGSRRELAEVRAALNAADAEILDLQRERAELQQRIANQRPHAAIGILAEVRTALRTPNGADVVKWARSRTEERGELIEVMNQGRADFLKFGEEIRDILEAPAGEDLTAWARRQMIDLESGRACAEVLNQVREALFVAPGTDVIARAREIYRERGEALAKVRSMNVELFHMTTDRDRTRQERTEARNEISAARDAAGCPVLRADFPKFLEEMIAAHLRYYEGQAQQHTQRVEGLKKELEKALGDLSKVRDILMALPGEDAIACARAANADRNELIAQRDRGLAELHEAKQQHTQRVEGLKKALSEAEKERDHWQHETGSAHRELETVNLQLQQSMAEALWFFNVASDLGGWALEAVGALMQADPASLIEEIAREFFSPTSPTYHVLLRMADSVRAEVGQ